ncbi:MAG: sugar transferase [Acidobacteriaceae bacterium]|nr:sugar transferase [Acidobacteriaceae bacterium]
MTIQATVLSKDAIRFEAEIQSPEAEAKTIVRNRTYRWLRHSRMMLVDLVLLMGVLMQLGVASSLHRYGKTMSDWLSGVITVRDVVLVLLCAALWAPILWTVGLYRQFNFSSLMRRVLLAAVACSAVLWGVCRWLRPETKLDLAIPVFFASALAVLFAPRILVMLWARSGFAESRVKRDVVILGSGNMAQQMAWQLRHHASEEYRILGFIDAPEHAGDRMHLGSYLCSLEELESFLMNNVIDEMHIALPVKSHYGEIERAVRLCAIAGIEPHYPAELFSTDVTKGIHSEEGRVVLRMTHRDSRWLLKRALDVVASGLGLLVLSPIFLAVALAVRLSSKGPIFFKQTRYGLNKRRFSMLKFRSMVVDAEQRQADIEHMNEAGGPVFKITRDPRITGVGAFLRKTSLDELPQLLNVLSGQMSLVGPRPLNERDVHRFSELHLMRRFSVVPGMTGLWQVSGRSNLEFSQWIELDLRYIDHWSLKLDLRILLQTIPAVLRGRGAS